MPGRVAAKTAWICLAVSAAAVIASAAHSAGGQAKASQSGDTGFDISWPQCGSPYPVGGAFAIVGVNGGLPYRTNPCLGTGDGPSELAWAGANAQVYANTADPGPVLSSHWPSGRSTPQPCDTPSNPGQDTQACHYDYGWNAAADSYQDLVDAYISLGQAEPGATRTPAPLYWWLAVDTANSWTPNTAWNVDSLQGEVDLLHAVGSIGVGFVATPSDWQEITGSTEAFVSSSSWPVGASSLTEAQTQCGGPGFTGGGVAIVQFPSGAFDGDYRCPQLSQLKLSSSSQALIAGKTSAAVQVTLSQPAASVLTVTVRSTSKRGLFAPTVLGPWSATLTLTAAAGETTTTLFYYLDTIAGKPVLDAAAPGWSDGSLTEIVHAGPVAGIMVSPERAVIRIGQRHRFLARGKDRFGNRLTVSPQWSLTPPNAKLFRVQGGSVVLEATRNGRSELRASTDRAAGTATVVTVQ